MSVLDWRIVHVTAGWSLIQERMSLNGMRSDFHSGGPFTPQEAARIFRRMADQLDPQTSTPPPERPASPDAGGVGRPVDPRPQPA